MHTKLTKWAIAVLALGVFLFGCGDFTRTDTCPVCRSTFATDASGMLQDTLMSPGVNMSAPGIPANQSGISATLANSGPSSASRNWRLVWSDEFDGPADSAPDPTKWHYLTGGGGFGQGELECNVNSTNNAYRDGAGNLIVKAISEPGYSCPGGTTNNYTSARLSTYNQFMQAYGRFEARIKLPRGKGIWPAFWMLGSNQSLNWPANGEIDIMENRGDHMDRFRSSIHGTGYTGVNYGQDDILTGVDLSAGYHVYAMEWEPGKISFYFDGTLFKTFTPADIDGNTWAFDQAGNPFYLLLDIAVGGSYPGDPDHSTIFPQVMTVDYVRVYAAANEAAP